MTRTIVDWDTDSNFKEFVCNTLGEIKGDIKRLDEKINCMTNEGCVFGRSIDKRISEHCTQHKTAYIIFTVIASSAALVVNMLFK